MPQRALFVVFAAVAKLHAWKHFRDFICFVVGLGKKKKKRTKFFGVKVITQRKKHTLPSVGPKQCCLPKKHDDYSPYLYSIFNQ